MSTTYAPAPGVDGAASISSENVCRIVGCSFRQLDTWVRAGVLVPTVNGVGSGRARRWTHNDVALARVCTVLAGLLSPHRVISRVVAQIEADPSLWASTVVIGADGRIGAGEGWYIDLTACHRHVQAGLLS